MFKINSISPRSGRRAIAAIAALASLSLAHSVAHAIPLPVAGNVGVSGTTTAANPDLAGTVLRDVVTNLTITTNSGGQVNFSIQDRVVKRKSTGTLDFYFRVIHQEKSKDAISWVRRSKFGDGMALDVDYRTDGLGSHGALAVQRSGAGGDVVTFDFANNPIPPGKESRFHFIATKATEFDVSGLTSIVARGGGSVGLKTAEPIFKEQPVKDGKPNLIVKLGGPKRTKRGADISGLLKIAARNTGTAPAPGTVGTLNPEGGYMIDIVLSTDRTCPADWAVYSPNWSEDVLLLGGRVSNTLDLNAGATRPYSGQATIPLDTPPGRYYLIARIDSGNKVDETNEADNISFIPIIID